MSGLNEDHRYFPEWANRPEIPGPPLEADHNSYLAGGYSEEFGYRTDRGWPPVFPSLQGDPDESQLWRVHIKGLHPGYPECPRPEDRDRPGRGEGRWPSFESIQPPRRGVASSRDSADRQRPSAEPIGVIRVGERRRATSHHDGLSARLASMWSALHTGHREPGR